MQTKIEESEKTLTPKEIERVEKSGGFKFPDEYKQFLLRNNGGRPTPGGFVFHTPKGLLEDSVVDWFYSIYEGEVNNLEEAIEIFTRADRMPKQIIPIGCDPFGNQICISVGGKDYGHVYFWDHENEAGPKYRNLFLIARSFSSFLKGLKDLA